MKRILPLLIVLVSFTQSYAQTSQLLTGENFTGYTNGQLNGQGGSYPWTTTGNSNAIAVANATPLTVPNYTSGTQYVNLTQRDDYTSFVYPYFYYPDDPYKKFLGSTAVTTSTATTFFMSFVVKVPNNSGTASTPQARPTFALRTSTGDNLANFYIADNGVNLKFGINKDGGQDGVYGSSNYTFGNTYLIVVRYDLATGSTTNDKMYMWVNPSLAVEPTVGTADATMTSGSDGGFSGNVTGIQLFQNQYSATASMDAFRVSYARNFGSNSLAAWNALSPIGTPLPVKFGDINAASKGGGIQVDWSVYTELSVDHYEIERSTDGVSYTAIGKVAAQNADGTLFYDWFDAAPVDGNNFYRIKNVDLDGKSSLSPVVRVSLGKSSTIGLRVYPNPVIGNHINFQAGDLRKGVYTLQLFNAAGQQVYAKQISHGGGALSQSLQLPSGVTAGIYNIRLAGSDYKIAKTFLVQ